MSADVFGASMPLCIVPVCGRVRCPQSIFRALLLLDCTSFKLLQDLGTTIHPDIYARYHGTTNVPVHSAGSLGVKLLTTCRCFGNCVPGTGITCTPAIGCSD
uniref:Uncharacterized protein n=1 Tax=Rhipicephalus appendiculatus TaxID=34631 RepID=A0A131YF31_RHIAP